MDGHNSISIALGIKQLALSLSVVDRPICVQLVDCWRNFDFVVAYNLVWIAGFRKLSMPLVHCSRIGSNTRGRH